MSHHVYETNDKRNALENLPTHEERYIAYCMAMLEMITNL